MSKRRLVITAVLAGQSQSEVSRSYGVSQGWISKLMARYRLEGEAAFEPLSRARKTLQNATGPETVELVLRLRKQLDDAGLDAIVNAATGEILRDLIIDPRKDYQPTGRPPGPTKK
jgi:transposase